jgi:2Fe-2S ferredoxin
MPEIVFADPAGERHRIACELGTSLMRAALNAAVPGIIAECGGCMTCGTCHVHVETKFFEHLPPPSANEAAMLEMLIGRDSSSRLSCQIRVSAGLDGMTVKVSGHNG